MTDYQIKIVWNFLDGVTKRSVSYTYYVGRTLGEENIDLQLMVYIICIL